jgi:hypothetical protein
MAVIREVSVRCPKCKIPLVHIPKPIAEDIVVCPDCGASGDFKYVIEKGGNLSRGIVPLATLQELLSEAG